MINHSTTNLAHTHWTVVVRHSCHLAFINLYETNTVSIYSTIEPVQAEKRIECHVTMAHETSVSFLFHTQTSILINNNT